MVDVASLKHEIIFSPDHCFLPALPILFAVEKAIFEFVYLLLQRSILMLGQSILMRKGLIYTANLDVIHRSTGECVRDHTSLSFV